MKKVLDIINTLDRRYIFLFIGLAVSLPLFFPIGIKFTVTHPVQGFYDTIEKVPNGSKILMSCDYDPGSAPELYPMTISALEQMFKKDLKFMLFSDLWNAHWTKIVLFFRRGDITQKWSYFTPKLGHSKFC